MKKGYWLLGSCVSAVLAIAACGDDASGDDGGGGEAGSNSGASGSSGSGTTGGNGGRGGSAPSGGAGRPRPWSARRSERLRWSGGAARTPMPRRPGFVPRMGLAWSSRLVCLLRSARSRCSSLCAPASPRSVTRARTRAIARCRSSARATPRIPAAIAPCWGARPTRVRTKRRASPSRGCSPSPQSARTCKRVRVSSARSA